MSSYTRQQLESWLKTIDVSGKVIDIGGSQNPIKGRTKSWDVDDYKILDLEEPHECKQKPDYTADLNYDFVEEYPNVVVDAGDSDIAFCLEVSEYWWNPVQALKNIALLLKQGGVLYISFHFVYPVHNPIIYDYIRYTENGVMKMLIKAGFDIETITPREMTDGQAGWDMFVVEEKMRPAKEYTGHSSIGCLIKAIKT